MEEKYFFLVNERKVQVYELIILGLLSKKILS